MLEYFIIHININKIIVYLTDKYFLSSHVEFGKWTMASGCPRFLITTISDRIRGDLISAEGLF
jgi:hypothetical protein